MGSDLNNLSVADKAEALFGYLEEFSKIRMKIVRNVNDYASDCIDLESLPTDNGWIEVRFRDSANNDGPVLSVAKPEFKTCPQPPDEIAPWIASGWESYKNQIGFKFPPEELAEANEEAPQDLFMSDPARAQLFEEWGGERDKWVTYQTKATEASGVYERLFKMKEKLKSDPDKLEVVAASMNVRLSEDKRVDHPVFTRNMRIQLDAEKGIISVEDVDSSTLIQKDLLSQSQNLTMSKISEAEQRLDEEEVHPLDRDAIAREAKLLVNQLSPKSRYFDRADAARDQEADIDVRPGFYLIFRQRPDGTAGAIGRIVKTIDETQRVPAFLNGLLGEFTHGETTPVFEDLSDGSTVSRRLAEANGEDDEILLAKPANRAQLEIAKRIEQDDAGLVQGPPGTGKTLLAKAVAGEAGVPFFSMSGSDFVEMFVGVGASRVRDLFRQAKEKAPCIIFIDEIDAVGRARSKNPAMGGNDERENTLNALLTEMDGFGTNSGVIILAATNRADMLDKALLRAGRFDRQISVDLPDLTERKEIFQVHLRKVKIDDTVDIDFLSRQTPGFSGADIANVCNEAALIAARHNNKTVGKQDFLNAVDRIIGGLEKKTKVMTNDEKRTIALHEAGHATVSWFCEHANPLVKVSIVPRGRALGAAWYLPEERQITTKEQMLDEMCALLGGRAAEELFTGHISTGAMNDLERATKSAYGMIAYAGMSERLPNICYYNNQEYQFQRPYSETTAKIMDDEVLKMINDEYARAKQILKEHSEGHNKLAELLMTREVIFAEDVEQIFGKRPWVSRSEEIMEDNTPKLEDMPDEVKEAQAEHEAAKKANLNTNDDE